jgi:hypothetical protein
MVASTNLVIELGIVLYLLLGWQFVVAQIVGGVVMIMVLLPARRTTFFSRSRQDALRQRVLGGFAAPDRSLRRRAGANGLSERDNYSRRRALHDGRHHDVAQGTARRIPGGRLHHRARAHLVVVTPVLQRARLADRGRKRRGGPAARRRLLRLFGRQHSHWPRPCGFTASPSAASSVSSSPT